MKERFVRFCKEVRLQAKILFEDGRAELKLYRLERGQTVIWAPSKGNWVRARFLHHGQKYDRIQFVDGKGGKGKRSPLSYRTRDPRKRGDDKPSVDARYSGNRGPYGASILERLYQDFFRLTHRGPTAAEMANALNAHLTVLEGMKESFYSGPLGLPYKPEGG